MGLIVLEFSGTADAGACLAHGRVLPERQTLTVRLTWAAFSVVPITNGTAFIQAVQYLEFGHAVGAAAVRNATAASAVAVVDARSSTDGAALISTDRELSTAAVVVGHITGFAGPTRGADRTREPSAVIVVSTAAALVIYAADRGIR
jgi:hypothetical protein